MNISIIGAGYVGLTTGASLAERGHHVCCVDKDQAKICLLQSGSLPIYEPGLQELLNKNMEKGSLFFSENLTKGCDAAEVIYITVGTPQNPDGTVDLTDFRRAAIDLAKIIYRDTIIVTKSTVPVGTNDWLKQLIEENMVHGATIEVVSNP